LIAQDNTEMKVLLCCFVLMGGLSAAEMKFGKPMVVKDPVTVSALLSKPAAYAGKTVQVKGKITEVCQMMGCWMNIAGEDGKSVRLKVNDGDMVFPKDSPGKMAVAEGTLTTIQLSREQALARAKHEAEESGRSFNAASVKGPVTLYELRPTGVVISD
jgi:hypothetical protein